MKPRLRAAGLLAAIFLVLAPDISFEPSPWVPCLPLQVTSATAEAQVGGVRRRTRRRTAVVVGTSTQAAADQQAAAEQEAAAAEQRAAEAEQEAAEAEQRAAAAEQQAAAAGQPLPVGTVVQKLPDGCTSKTVGGVEYHQCGGNYYRAAFQENNLVYVTTAPPN
ncbi:MAG: hypothetical protein V3T20_10210 [Gemmatimonadota bacterium]